MEFGINNITRRKNEIPGKFREEFEETNITELGSLDMY
jgi:hypothetical protein